MQGVVWLLDALVSLVEDVKDDPEGRAELSDQARCDVGQACERLIKAW